MSKVLIVDDNHSVCDALALLLSIHDIESERVHKPADAIKRLGQGDIDLVIQDMNFESDTTSGEEGVSLFHDLRQLDDELPIILLTAWAQLDTAVELVREGAADYQRKPWDDDRLVTMVQNLLALRESRKAAQEIRQSQSLKRKQLAQQYDLCGLVYRSDAMHDVVSVACKVAKANVPVLITGPSGSGKEKIAEIIQKNSDRAGRPFIRVNVGALSPDLVASELFGAVAGAYTSASKTRDGHFHAAEGGTLFLDEIATLPADGQVKLLRVLQSGEYQRLGSSTMLKANVRVISATNAALDQKMRDGEFREDLYYRLNMIELSIPPLAERRDDIEVLVEAFIDEQHRLDAGCLKALLQYSWPGNVRELENVVRRACLLTDGELISPQDLALGGPGAQGFVEWDEASLRKLLLKHKGVVAAAAREAGLSRQAFYRRLEKYGLHQG